MFIGRIYSHSFPQVLGEDTRPPVPVLSWGGVKVIGGFFFGKGVNTLTSGRIKRIRLFSVVFIVFFYDMAYSTLTRVLPTTGESSL